MSKKHCSLCDTPHEVHEKILKSMFAMGLPVKDPEQIDLLILVGGLAVGRMTAKDDQLEMLIYCSSTDKTSVILKTCDMDDTLVYLSTTNQLKSFCADVAMDIVHEACKMEEWHNFMENLTVINTDCTASLIESHKLNHDVSDKDGWGYAVQ